ncbi:hypothetical protein Q1695_008746 [Nippostrongylus brasiliensis]|nr:hypothetical protein Q1695_008746 [Nippostrongylus brasiliensis]
MLDGYILYIIEPQAANVFPWHFSEDTANQPLKILTNDVASEQVPKGEYVAEYCPDLLSNFSNSSGTISYETIITPRKNEQRELQFAAEGTVPKEQAHFLRELQLLPPPVIPEIVEWDLVKRINKLLLSKEQEKKTVEVQRSEKGTVQQNKRIIAEALNKFLAKPTGMAMNIATVANSKPSKLAIKVCPTEWIRTPSSPLVTLKTLEAAFSSDPYYITETELVQEQTELFKKRVQVRLFD